ncbi:hypothetical protein [Litchfieldia salsa]|uniref:Uncharacterized protein n=1 Tax=Litchfieldia salsa TaxID=930152 RepID=A0A1H0U1J3_9BACI|nr:hypothetical protein [Litchfieldia salsa]SDP59875.1 hypothetical protein SAMN05216565_10476 [Litchfieldia salsa]
MGNTCRFVVNAIGKGGETYYTHCKDKQELKNWISENQDKLSMSDLKISDRSRNPLLRLVSLIK